MRIECPCGATYPVGQVCTGLFHDEWEDNATRAMLSCLAHNLAVAGGLALAEYYGQMWGVEYMHRANKRHVKAWASDQGRPAPGWDKTPTPSPDVQAVCPAPGREGEP